MKHKIKNCTLIFLLFFLFSCGFKAINSKNDNLIEIEDIQINGEKRLGYYLKNELLLNSKKDGENKRSILLPTFFCFLPCLLLILKLIWQQLPLFEKSY